MVVILLLLLLFEIVCLSLHNPVHLYTQIRFQLFIMTDTRCVQTHRKIVKIFDAFFFFFVVFQCSVFLILEVFVRNECLNINDRRLGNGWCNAHEREKMSRHAGSHAFCSSSSSTSSQYNQTFKSALNGKYQYFHRFEPKGSLIFLES